MTGRAGLAIIGPTIIPHHVARDIPRVNAELAAKEKVILDIVKAPDFTFARLRAAMGGPKDIH